MHQQAAPRAAPDDEQFQNDILAGVSRTFALTIPQLPPTLRGAVTNAYLLCRIADTIEDDPAIDAADGARFHQCFIEVLEGRSEPEDFARRLEACLSPESDPSERALIRHAGRVIRLTRALDDAARAVLIHRVTLMCRGMPRFQQGAARRGLRDLDVMDQYCYYVAGVVGQMLTELFSLHSPAVAARRGPLFHLSASFGQGLQMTNILKDVWEDHARGACWLPRDVFAAHGCDLDTLHPEGDRAAFAAGLAELVGVTHGHLRNALRYTLLIPRREAGIRRFCLWSVVLAVLTLRRIRATPHYTAGAQVKVSRRTVRRTIHLTHAACHSNLLIRALFAWSARGLPLARDVTTYPEFSEPALRTQ